MDKNYEQDARFSKALHEYVLGLKRAETEFKKELQIDAVKLKLEFVAKQDSSDSHE